MTYPVDRNILFHQGIDDTSDRSSRALTASRINPTHAERTHSFNGHGAIDINLSLNSATDPTSQNEAVPMRGQLGLQQHVAEARVRRSNLSLPGGIRAHSMTSSHLMQQQNTVNINIVVGNNSSVNINLLNNNLPSQFTRNNPFAYSNFGQPSITLASNHEPIPSNLLEINQNSQFTTSCSQYVPPIVTTVSGNALSTRVPNIKRETPTSIPCPRENIVGSSSHQARLSHPPGIDGQHHNISQRNSDLSFFNMLSSYFPSDNDYHLPALPSSSMNSPRTDFHEDGLHFQLNHLENHPAREHASDQAFDPITNDIWHSQSHPQPLSQVPLQNDIFMEPQRTPAQNTSPNRGTNHESRARARQKSAVRSHPYVKYGPYTCPQCHDIFESGNCFAAHVNNHYKNESPSERKKRREAKIRNRDLRLTQSQAGITVIPGSLQGDDELPVTPNISHPTATKRNQGQGFASVKVKEEVFTD